MTPDDAELSRVVSHALRHEPWVYELELDADGWVDLEQLVTALAERGGPWSELDGYAVHTMLLRATKQRHEISHGRIRALYGHSLVGRIARDAAEPPDSLFHGTSAEVWDEVRHEGLRPMGRQYVHLSCEETTAQAVGRRKTATPVIAVIDARAAASEGVRFYRGNDLVCLADEVPARFLRLAAPAC